MYDIDEVALGDGFFIDDDGNWIPLEDADDFDIEYYGLEDAVDRLYDEDDDDYNEEMDDWDD